MSDLVEIVETQNEIIRIQSDIIDELFALLSQHLSTNEIGMLPALGKAERAVKLRKEIKEIDC